MQQVLKRSECSLEVCWKLEDLFSSQTEWDKEFSLVHQLLEKMKFYQGKLSHAQTLQDCFKLEDNISLHADRLFVYAHLRHEEDMYEERYRALAEKASQLKESA